MRENQWKTSRPMPATDSATLPLLYVLAVALLQFAAVPMERLQAQSAVIEMPNSGGPATMAIVSDEGIASDLTQALLATEARLVEPTPVYWRDEIAMGQLLDWMNSAGIPIHLHESAIDNDLNETTRVRMALHYATLQQNLQFVLDLYQCGMTIDHMGQIKIASVDYLIENPTTVTQDITSIPADPYELVETIQEIVDPDGWEENGGTGRMRLIQSGQHRLLVVTNTYRNQVAVRHLLRSLKRMAYGTTKPAPMPLSPTMGGSLVLGTGLDYLPWQLEYGARDPRFYGGGFGGGGFGGGAGGGGGGVGGGGLGGGVF